MTDRLLGILLGTAVGDALGLPAEGLGPGRCRRLFPGPWRHRFLLGRGMVTDDTEHTLFVAESLLVPAVGDQRSALIKLSLT
ncbi:MAG: ADP-ribosylglycohydrolase family protein [Pirellulaceae bacterium]